MIGQRGLADSSTVAPFGFGLLLIGGLTLAFSFAYPDSGGFSSRMRKGNRVIGATMCLVGLGVLLLAGIAAIS